MKKLLALACVVLFSSAAFAATEFTAAVTFSGGTVSFDASLQTGSQLTWDTTKINIAQSTVQWKPATAYIQMTKTITKAGGKVYFYQDNTAAKGSGDEKYVAVSSRTERESDKTGKIIEIDLKKFNGLVKGGSKGGETGFTPMSFKISTVTLATPDMTGGIYGTRYLTDKSDTKLNKEKTAAVPWEKDGYCTVADANGFIADVNEDGVPEAIEGSSSVSTGYMYIGAGFKNVMGGDSYGSNHLKFEVVEE